MQGKIKLKSIGSALLISILLTGCEAQVDRPNNTTPTITNVTESKTDISSVEGNQPEDSSALSESSDEQSDEKQASDTIEFISQNTEISDEHKDVVSSYPPDFYSQTIPPEEKSLEFYTFNGNPKVFSCAISDNSLTDNEKIEVASKLLAEEYIKDCMSDEYSFRILEYRNVAVDFIEHTIDRPPFDPTQYSISNGIGDMEVSENAWVIDIDAEIKFSGTFGFVSSAELDGENVWNHIPIQGMSEKYLLYRQDDIFYLWSRDVYHYKR